MVIEREFHRSAKRERPQEPLTHLVDEGGDHNKSIALSAFWSTVSRTAVVKSWMPGTSETSAMLLSPQ